MLNKEIFEGFKNVGDEISNEFKDMQEEMFGDDKELKAEMEMFLIAKLLEQVMGKWGESEEEKQKKSTNEEAIKASKPSPCMFNLNKEKERLEKEELDRLKELKRLREENEELKREVDELKTVIKIGLKQGFIDSSFCPPSNPYINKMLWGKKC